MERLKNYHGGKNGSGVYQQIISMMPPHKIYVEAFLGSGAILWNKRPAECNIGIDLDSSVLHHIPDAEVDRDIFDILKNGRTKTNQLFTGNAIEKLRDFDLLTSICANTNNKDALVYADPPYLMSVRRSKTTRYKYELLTEAEYLELLTVLKSLPCSVMISHYKCDFYDQNLKGWRTESFKTTNRAGKRVTETVYLNFEKPLQLHDYRYLGNGFREREKIKRQKTRWVNRLSKMDAQKMFALMAALEEITNPVLTPETAMLDHRQK